jgi:predicted Zn finger-like uncharacterized protein
MLIVCPSCASEYALDPERVGKGGRKVRCAVCRTTWLARRPEPSADEVQASNTEAGGQTIDAVPDQPRPPATTVATRKGAAPNRTRDVLAAAAIAALLIAAPTAVALRKEVVRHVPASAATFAAVGLGVNLVELDLADISAATGQEGSTRVLFIEGEIRSVAPHHVPVPRLELAINDKDDLPLYRWSVKPPIGELGPGETARFTARLASPPPDGAKLIATFQSTRGDRSIASR